MERLCASPPTRIISAMHEDDSGIKYEEMGDISFHKITLSFLQFIRNGLCTTCLKTIVLFIVYRDFYILPNPLILSICFSA